MNSVERVKRLCKERKIAISKLEKDLGFANGYIGQLKKGVFPTDRAGKIADYFNVSLNYITDGLDDDGLNEKDNKDIAKDLDSIMRKLSSGEDGPATFDGKPLSEESAELFKDQLEIMLRNLKIINKEKYTPKKYKG